MCVFLHIVHILALLSYERVYFGNVFSFNNATVLEYCFLVIIVAIKSSVKLSCVCHVCIKQPKLTKPFQTEHMRGASCNVVAVT